MSQFYAHAQELHRDELKRKLAKRNLYSSTSQIPKLLINKKQNFKVQSC